MRARWFTLAGLIAPGVALANPPNTGPDREQFFVNMSVAPRCALGSVEGDPGQFDMGILIDRGTGFLRRDLSAPSKRLVGSFCNAPSELRIEAVLMTPLGASGDVLPQGFARGVHFVATATGWTDEPAIFRTDLNGDQPSATRQRPGPHQGEILVDVSEFHMNGGDDRRPIASRRYEGVVVVTLGPVA